MFSSLKTKAASLVGLAALTAAEPSKAEQPTPPPNAAERVRTTDLFGDTVILPPVHRKAKDSYSIIDLKLSDDTANSHADNIVRGPIGEKLDTYCKNCAEEGWFSGSVYLAKKGEAVLWKGYGGADYEHQVANTPHTRYEIASLSKQFTAAAILLLHQEGDIDIEKPFSNYLPDGVPKYYRGVTVYNLLTHTGGLPRGSSARGLNLREVVQDALKVAPKSLAGQKYSYSNVDYALLAGIVEHITGDSLEEYCHQKLFLPAGLNSTSFCGEELPATGEVALGYNTRTQEPRAANRDPYPPLDAFGYEYKGMGGVVTNIDDLVKWTEVLKDDTVLSKSSREKLFTPFLSNYGCGWEIFTFPDGRRCIGHGGSVRGFRAKLWYFPDDNDLLIVLTNKDSFKWSWLSKAYDISYSPKNTK